MLEGGEYGSIEELARAEKINPSYLARVLRLTLLAPEITESILDGDRIRRGHPGTANEAVSGGVGRAVTKPLIGPFCARSEREAYINWRPPITFLGPNPGPIFSTSQNS